MRSDGGSDAGAMGMMSIWGDVGVVDGLIGQMGKGLGLLTARTIL
jgi:hypothetical protein